MELKCRELFDQVPREKINPYWISAKIFLQRLAWDIHPYSWRSRKKLSDCKNIHSGKKAIILCSGPSLNKVDFDDLTKSNIFTFCLNKINLIFRRTTFRPSAVVCVNPFVIQQNKFFYNTTNIPIFIDYKGKRWVNYRSNIYFLHSTESHTYFARDCSISVNQGSTVTFVAMQIAFHMGFSNVALVGCDHNFKSVGPPNKIVSSEKEDPNHFDPQYFSNGIKWQLPDLKSSELHYEKARDIFSHFGRQIINCTEGGRLDIFKRATLRQFIEQ